jgi:hypothetical protein
LAEQHKYRKFTASQKLEIVLAGLRADREHDITRTESPLPKRSLLGG